MAQMTTTFSMRAWQRRQEGTLRRHGKRNKKAWKRNGRLVEEKYLRGAAFRNNGRSEEHVDNISTSIDVSDEERAHGEQEKTMWTNVEEKIVEVGDSLDEASVRLEDSGLWIKFIAVILPLWAFAIYYEMHVMEGALS